mgnify:CR=1 FL=1
MRFVLMNCLEIDAFKRRWPANGFPDDLNNILFEFADNGDLVNIDAKDDNGVMLDTEAFDGPALLVLSKDAQSKPGILNQN